MFNKRSHQEIPHAFFAAHSSANDDEGRLYGINPIYIGGDTAYIYKHHFVIKVGNSIYLLYPYWRLFSFPETTIKWVSEYRV